MCGVYEVSETSKENGGLGVGGAVNHNNVGCHIGAHLHLTHASNPMSSGWAMADVYGAVEGLSFK